MTWNYRVWKCTQTFGETVEVTYEFRETYYNQAGEICACTEEPLDVHGESLEEIKENLERCIRALEQPVLEYDNFEFAEW